MAKQPPKRTYLLDLHDVAGSEYDDAGTGGASAGPAVGAGVGGPMDRLHTSINGSGAAPASGGSSRGVGMGAGATRETIEAEELPTLEASESSFYKTLTNAVKPTPLPLGAKQLVAGDVAHHPFPEPPPSTAGKLGMVMMKATGAGYVYYRVASTRLRPGEITYLQDGSDQYVISRPGLYYFPGPTRTLYEPVRMEGEIVALGNVKIVTVPPGRVGFCRFKNQIHVLDPGHQYVLDSPYLEYLRSEALSNERIEVDSVSLISVQAGQLAIVRDAQGHIVVIKEVGRFLLRQPEMLLGLYSMNEELIDVGGYQRCRLLAGKLIFYRDFTGETKFFDEPGVYEMRSPASFIGSFHQVNQREISEGSIHIFRLQAGELACVSTISGDVAILEEPKRYILRAPERLLGTYSVNEPRIEHGTYERVRLQAGCIVFWQDENGRTRFYDTPGTYALKRPAFFDRDIHDVNASVLKFGSIVRLNLKHGEISFKYTETGATELLSVPGVHLIDRPEQYGGAICRKSERTVQLGAFTLVNVPPGHIAITYDGRENVAGKGSGPMDSKPLSALIGGASRAGGFPQASSTSDGALRILREGHHYLDHELWRLQEIRSIQEKRLDLKCTVYSRNRVTFAVGAFVLFKVMDPKRAFIDVENIEDELRREAEATLLSIWMSHDSDEIAKGVQDPAAHPAPAVAPLASGSASGAPAAAADPDLPSYDQSFAEIVRSAFQHTIRTFAEERGVALTRMRVEHVDFTEPKMRAAIEQQAEMSIQITAQRKNIEQRNQTLLLEAEGKAAALQVESTASANAKNLETQAEVTRIKEIAEAQNVASRTPLAMQLALIDAYAKGQAGIFSALGSKVAVVPSDISLSMGSLPAQIQSLMAGANASTATFTVGGMASGGASSSRSVG